MPKRERVSTRILVFMYKKNEYGYMFETLKNFLPDIHHTEVRRDLKDLVGEGLVEELTVYNVVPIGEPFDDPDFEILDEFTKKVKTKSYRLTIKGLDFVEQRKHRSDTTLLTVAGIFFAGVIAVVIAYWQIQVQVQMALQSNPSTSNQITSTNPIDSLQGQTNNLLDTISGNVTTAGIVLPADLPKVKRKGKPTGVNR